MKFEERAFCPVARRDTRLHEYETTNDRYSFFQKERNSSNTDSLLKILPARLREGY